MEDLRGYARQYGQARTIERNDFLLQAGKVEQHIYLVLQGALRIFYLSEYEEHTIRFGYRGSLINSLASFLQDAPSEFYLQAIRKTEILVLGKSQFQQFVAEDPRRATVYTSMLEALICQQLEREIDLLTHSPLERLQRVQKRSPQLFQEIPAKYIASYLRMTPETLSRIQKS